MAPNNRYAPEFKNAAVEAFTRRRADYPGEARADSLQVIASQLSIPVSTLGRWARSAVERPAGAASGSTPPGAGEKGTDAPPAPIVVHVPRKGGGGVQWLALLVSIVAIVWPQYGANLQHTKEQQKNAQSYFEAVSGPNPPSYGALALRYAGALNYTEQGSPAARIITLASESSRVVQRANATPKTSKGSTVSRTDDGYQACDVEDSTDCVSYYSLEFDEQDRLRSYSFKDNRRLDSMLLNKDESVSETDDSKVSLIEGLENLEGKILFVAQVTNKRTDETATIDFENTRYASGGQIVTAKGVAGPSRLGPNESVAIAGFVDHSRGITLSLPLAYQSEDGKNPPHSSVLLIKLF